MVKKIIHTFIYLYIYLYSTFVYVYEYQYIQCYRWSWTQNTQIRYEKLHVNIFWESRKSEVQKLQIPQIGVRL